MATLPLSGILDITVETSPITRLRDEFNTALIIGGGAIISTSVRLEEYNSLEEVVDDGFLDSSDEYKAAALYFAQDPAPSRLFIGVKGSAESLLEAITACRDASPEWYVAIPVNSLLDSLTQSDIVALATYIESATPSSLLALTLTDPSTYEAILTDLEENEFSRTIAMYDDVLDNEDKTAIAAIIGYAMGANRSNLPAYTLAYKQLIGVKANEDISSVDLSSLLVKNGNIYINQASYYNLFRQGTMSSGVSFDEVLYIDMLVEKIKQNIMSILTTLPKVPQTNEGLNILANAIDDACEDFVGRGFLAPGVWAGPNVLALKKNDALSKGYLVQFSPLETQSSADRASRKAPNCYVCVKTSGSIEHVIISITVDR